MIEVPLRVLRDPSIHHTEQRTHNNVTYHLHFYDYNGYEIWGATGRIIHGFWRRANMPSGRTHDFITIVTGAVAAPVVLDSTLPDINPTNAMVLLGAYLASGLLFSPDLDLKSAPT